MKYMLPGCYFILSLLSRSGDKEAEGILSEAGHGGAWRDQRRPLQHEDSSGSAKWYAPPHTSHLRPSEFLYDSLVWFKSIKSGLEFEHELELVFAALLLCVLVPSPPLCRFKGLRHPTQAIPAKTACS